MPIMSNDLSLVESYTLAILKQLEYKCQNLRTDWQNKDETLPVYASDLDFSFLKKPADLYAVAQYLQKNKLDFSITFDLVNDSPYSKEYINGDNQDGEFTEIAKIKGTIDSISLKIKNLIHQLSVDYIQNQSVWITKDNKGNYFFDNEPLILNDADNQYQIIFDIAYSLKPEGGKIEYKKIISECRARGKGEITQKKILRALSGKEATLFKIVKNLKQKVSYGKDLFAPIRGKGEIQFNNQK